MQSTASSGGGGAGTTFSAYTPHIYQVERAQLQLIENGLSRPSDRLLDSGFGVAVGSAPTSFAVLVAYLTADTFVQSLEDIATFILCIAAIFICAASLLVSRTTKTPSQRTIADIRRQPPLSMVTSTGSGGSALAISP